MKVYYAKIIFGLAFLAVLMISAKIGNWLAKGKGKL